MTESYVVCKPCPPIIQRGSSYQLKGPLEDDLVFVGGVALNPCIQKLLERSVGRPVLIPEYPQITGALGCALAGFRV